MKSGADQDPRNVIDYFKYWSNDAIKACLNSRAAPFAVAMEHWNRDLNIGGLIRNANAFNAYEVFYIGRRNWDRRGAVGSYHYLRIQHFPDFESFHAHVDDLGYTLIGVDNTDNAEPIDETELPQRALFLFGEEGDGLTPEAIAAVEKTVYIKQYGSVRSLNAATASGITMYEWSKQHR